VAPWGGGAVARWRGGAVVEEKRYKEEGRELTTLSPSCVDFHEMWEPQPLGFLWVCPGLYWFCFSFTLFMSALVSIQCRGKKSMQFFFHSKILSLFGVVAI